MYGLRRRDRAGELEEAADELGDALGSGSLGARPVPFAGGGARLPGDHRDCRAQEQGEGRSCNRAGTVASDELGEPVAAGCGSCRHWLTREMAAQVVGECRGRDVAQCGIGLEGFQHDPVEVAAQASGEARQRRGGLRVVLRRPGDRVTRGRRGCRHRRIVVCRADVAPHPGGRDAGQQPVEQDTERLQMSLAVDTGRLASCSGDA